MTFTHTSCSKAPTKSSLRVVPMQVSNSTEHLNADSNVQATQLNPLEPPNDSDIPELKKWTCGEPFQYAQPCKEDPWAHFARLTEDYDKNMCDAWKSEIDNLLIFAGLFSAVLTAFLLQSFNWLREDFTETSLIVLLRISKQLEFSTMHQPINIPPLPTTTAEVFQPHQVDTSVARINTLWFVSLVLSLSTVLFGILCQQWLREYQRSTNLPYKNAIEIRHMRYEGLISWKVPSILTMLPLLLQFGVMLFFAGVIDLLWTMNRSIATVVTVLVSIIALCLILAAFMPTIQSIRISLLNGATPGHPPAEIPPCPYKSPLSWSVYTLMVRLGQLLHSIAGFKVNFNPSHVVHRCFEWLSTVLPEVPVSSWMDNDLRSIAPYKVEGTSHESSSLYLVKRIVWLHLTFSQNHSVVNSIHSWLLQHDCCRDSVGVIHSLNAGRKLLSYGNLFPSMSQAVENEERTNELAACCYLFNCQQEILQNQIEHALELYIRIVNSVNFADSSSTVDIHYWFRFRLKDILKTYVQAPKYVKPLEARLMSQFLLAIVKQAVYMDCEFRAYTYALVFGLLGRIVDPTAIRFELITIPSESQGHQLASSLIMIIDNLRNDYFTLRGDQQANISRLQGKAAERHLILLALGCISLVINEGWYRISKWERKHLQCTELTKHDRIKHHLASLILLVDNELLKLDVNVHTSEGWSNLLKSLKQEIQQFCSEMGLLASVNISQHWNEAVTMAAEVISPM